MERGTEVVTVVEGKDVEVVDQEKELKEEVVDQEEPMEEKTRGLLHQKGLLPHQKLKTPHSSLLWESKGSLFCLGPSASGFGLFCFFNLSYLDCNGAVMKI